MKQLNWWKQVSRSEYARIKKDMRCRLFYVIHQVLLLRQGPIHEFTLSMDAHDTCFEIDQIILHLSRNHTIKKLTFNFNDQSSYGLPLSFFTSLPQLTDLDLEHCVINHKPIFNGFGSLTRLSLSNISISKETLLHLLSNCPSLKSLCLLLFEEDFLSDGKPNIMELFKCLPVIEHLTTLGHIIRLKRLVQASVSKELPTSLIHLKYVCIEQMCFVDGYGLPFLAVLTKCCPNLEKIKLVKLTFFFYDFRTSAYGLPLSFFSLDHLTDLDLEHCAFNHKPIFNGFISLTTLSLKNVKFSKETLLHLLSNCPSLKILRLMLFDSDFLSDEKPSTMELFKSLPVIEHLTTWSYIIPSLVQASVPEEPPTLLIHLKYVCIKAMCFVDGYGLPFLAVLTKCCPNLEKIKLKINSDWDGEIDDVVVEECSVKLKEYSDVWLEHLNELEIKYFTNLEPELEFVKFILARSPALKKVMLLTDMHDENEES
ncbi:hypothetical protein M8C21_028452, partial [Ambrosia artemisiifolia]